MHYTEISHGKELLDALRCAGDEATFRQLRLGAGVGGAWQTLNVSVKKLCRHGWMKLAGTITIKGRNVEVYYGPCKPMS